MPSLMSSAMANLASALKTTAGESGTLARNGSTTAAVFAVIDTVSYELTEAGTGSVVSYVAIDLLIEPADYQIGAVQVEPTRGDTWSYTDEFSVAHEYTVMFVSGSPVFVKEPYSHIMRVHAKET